MGGCGAGYTTKHLVNLLWFGQAIATAEALLLARREGIDLGLMPQARAGSAASSSFIRDDLGALFDGDYLTSFGLDRSHDLTGRSVYLVQKDSEEMTMMTTKQAPVSTATPTHTTITSRLGDLTVVARDGVVTGLYFPHHWYLPDRASFGERNDTGFHDVRERLAGYLAGDRRRFDVPVCARGDEFQQRVWDLIRQIPYGETVTYGELARDLGDGTTAQQAGAAVGRNPVCILIPCHRVVGTGGKLTGYAGGLKRKRFLLDLERGVARPPSRLF